MTRAAVVELPVEQPIWVAVYDTLEEARADFMERFEQLRASGQTVLDFDAGADDGMFRTNGTTVWFTEATD